MASVSWSLTRSKINYVALELECLAIVFACQKFDQHIFVKQVQGRNISQATRNHLKEIGQGK